MLHISYRSNHSRFNFFSYHKAIFKRNNVKKSQKTTESHFLFQKMQQNPKTFKTFKFSRTFIVPTLSVYPLLGERRNNMSQFSLIVTRPKGEIRKSYSSIIIKMADSERIVNDLKNSKQDEEEEDLW